MNIEAALKRLGKMKAELERLGCEVEIKVSIERPDYQQEYMDSQAALSEKESELNLLRGFIQDIGIPYSRHMHAIDLHKMAIKLRGELLTSRKVEFSRLILEESESEDAQ